MRQGQFFLVIFRFFLLLQPRLFIIESVKIEFCHLQQWNCRQTVSVRLSNNQIRLSGFFRNSLNEAALTAVLLQDLCVCVLTDIGFCPFHNFAQNDSVCVWLYVLMCIIMWVCVSEPRMVRIQRGESRNVAALSLAVCHQITEKNSNTWAELVCACV